MKNHAFYLLGLLATTSLFAALSFPEHSTDNFKTIAVTLIPDRAIPPAQMAIIPVASTDATYKPLTTDLFSGMSNALETVTRDQTTQLASLQENLERNLSAEIANWKAHGGNTTPMSEEHLALARTDFRQKINALSLVDEETFRSAKENAISSLKNVQQAYGELLVSTDHN
jgi:hypothetical protein